MNFRRLDAVNILLSLNLNFLKIALISKNFFEQLRNYMQDTISMTGGRATLENKAVNTV